MDDYYSSVYAWFEKCGIISNIRTHLRQNLVNALKSKEFTLKRDNNTPKSPKQYIYDLLIAEYLLNCNYTYSLSVFTSEAPLLFNFNNNLDTQDTTVENGQKLQQDYVLHILETLGIKPEVSEERYILSEYNTSNVSLLLCILKYVESVFHDIKHMQETVKEDKLSSNKCTQTNPVENFNDVDMESLLAIKRKIFEQKNLFDAQLQEREMILKEQAVIMEQQLLSLNEKLEKVQNCMHLLTIQGKELNEKKQNDICHITQKEMELSLRQNFLLQETARLQRERESYAKFESHLKKLQNELVKIQKELPNSANSNLSVINIETQTNFENYVTEEHEIKILEKEKRELISLVQEQRVRIEQLTQRIVQLSRQLEKMQSCQIVDIKEPITRSTTTIINESSSTEDILQDAKMRLKRLEKESLKADQCYYNFISASPH